MITVPVGLAAKAVIAAHPVRAAVVVAFAISCLCEWAQVFESGRFPSATDVVCNTLGAALGVVLVQVRHAPWIRRRRR
jgi:VanZ family protein